MKSDFYDDDFEDEKYEDDGFESCPVEADISLKSNKSSKLIDKEVIQLTSANTSQSYYKIIDQSELSFDAKSSYSPTNAILPQNKSKSSYFNKNESMKPEKHVLLENINKSVNTLIYEEIENISDSSPNKKKKDKKKKKKKSTSQTSSISEQHTLYEDTVQELDSPSKLSFLPNLMDTIVPHHHKTTDKSQKSKRADELEAKNNEMQNTLSRQEISIKNLTAEVRSLKSIIRNQERALLEIEKNSSYQYNQPIPSHDQVNKDLLEKAKMLSDRLTLCMIKERNSFLENEHLKKELSKLKSEHALHPMKFKEPVEHNVPSNVERRIIKGNDTNSTILLERNIELESSVKALKTSLKVQRQRFVSEILSVKTLLDESQSNCFNLRLELNKLKNLS